MIAKNRMAPFAMAVMALMLCGAFVCTDANAAGEDLTDTYGAPTEIKIAPGYSWSYTTTYPADLTAGVVLTAPVNDLGEGIAKIDGHKVTVEIPKNQAQGSYNLVLLATHDASGQTATQYIKIVVGAPLTVSYSGSINAIILGAQKEFELKSQGGVGEVTWTEVSIPDGMTFSATEKKVSGEPTKVGENVVKLTASTPLGESKDLEIRFTVYSVIVNGDAQTIYAIGGKSVSSDEIVEPEDLNVTWAADKSLPAGLNLDSTTGVISGTYGGIEDGESVVTLTGTSHTKTGNEDTDLKGDEQTATKVVTICYEPAFTLGEVTIKPTYTGNANTVSSSVMAPSTDKHSAITYSLKTPVTGISIDESTGVITIAGTAVVTLEGTVTIVATTAYTQEVEKDVSYIVEDTLAITGSDTLISYDGHANSESYSITGGSSNGVQLSENYNGGLTFADGRLNISYTGTIGDGEGNGEKVTLTVTSAAGQSITKDVTLTVFSKLSFTSTPSATGINAYAE